MPSQYLGRLLFVLIALGLISFFGYEGYMSNFSLNKSGELWEVFLVGAFAGSFFIFPLLLSVTFASKLPSDKLPWTQLFALCLGATFQSAMSQNFLYILVWPTNIALSCWIASRCYAGYMKEIKSKDEPNPT